MAVLLTAREIQKQYGSRILFEGVSLAINDGEIHGLIGPNGAGKSTLMQVLAGLETPDAGEVALRKGVRMVYVAQDPTFPPGTTVGGVLEADSRDALGTGDVVLNGGTLVSHTNDPLLIAGNYNQLSGSTLEIDLGRDGEGELTILGDAGYAGTLDINVQHDFQVVPGETFDVITTSYQQGAFATVNVTGTSAKWTVVYSDRGLHLKFHSDGRRH